MDSPQDYPVFPFEIINLISDHLVDSRPIYLTNKRLLANSTDRTYWESRGKERIRTHLVKIPTDLTLIKFAKYGNLQMVRYLYSLSKNVKANNFAIKYASKNNHLEIVKFLYSVGVDVTSGNNRAVRFASSSGHLPVVEFLHSVGANIKAGNNYAIRHASENGHLPVVKFLHSVGADVTADDNYAIRHASLNGHLAVVEFLLSIGATLD